MKCQFGIGLVALSESAPTALARRVGCPAAYGTHSLGSGLMRAVERSPNRATAQGQGSQRKECNTTILFWTEGRASTYATQARAAKLYSTAVRHLIGATAKMNNEGWQELLHRPWHGFPNRVVDRTGRIARRKPFQPTSGIPHDNKSGKLCARCPC